MYNLPDFIHLHFDKTADELGEVEKRVLKKAHERKIISTDINAAITAETSFGERIADGIAASAAHGPSSSLSSASWWSGR